METARHPDGSQLVLVIEDDMVAAGLIRTQLIDGGYGALVASGHAGVGAAKRCCPGDHPGSRPAGLDGWKSCTGLRTTGDQGIRFSS